MSRLVKGASSSQLLHKEQPDQKKIYMDWANHYLRKAHYSDTLSDLHECVQGDYLPKIIHAVVQSTVPGITVSPTTDEERAHNIRSCICHLEAKGVKCSSFSVSELSEGNMKAILSLFYSLSQFKRTTKSVSSEVPASRIARPVSPGLKNSYGVSSGTPPQTTTNGIAGGAGMGVATKSMISPATNKRTAGSSILTSTIDKPYGARRMPPYKNLVLSGEKPTALEDKEGEREVGNATSKLHVHGGLAATGSTSRLDQLSTKSGIPGSKPLQMEHSSHVSSSQPNLHRIPARSKSEPRIGQRVQQEQRKDSVPNHGDSSSGIPGQKMSSSPKRMLKQPSVGSVSGVSGRSTPSDHIMSGRTTPSKLSRPTSRLTKLGGETKVADKELSSDESEMEQTRLERRRSNSDAKRPAVSVPRSASRSSGEARGIPVSGGARGHQKSVTLNSDSRLVSPGTAVPSGDSLRQPQVSDKHRSSTSSEPGNTIGGGSTDGTKRVGLLAPSQRKLKAYSANLSSNSALSRKMETAGLGDHEREVASSQSAVPAKKEESSKGEVSSNEKEKSLSGMSKLSKPSGLRRFGSGGTSPSENRKSPLPPSGLSKFQSLSSSQGFIPTVRGSKGSHADLSGRERGTKGGRKERNSSNSSLESTVNFEVEERPAAVVPAKLDKQVSSSSSTGSSTQTETEKPKLVLPLDESSPSSSNKFIAPLAGGKDNRRISPEGMSTEGQPLANESITTPTEARKNVINRQDNLPKVKLIEEVGGDCVEFKKSPPNLEAQGADSTLDEDAVKIQDVSGVTLEIGVASESEIQTPNLSQGSEVATDSTLSSLSLTSVSSPHHNSHPSPVTSTAAYSQQPETGQAPYSTSLTPHGKRSSPPDPPHDDHMIDKAIDIEVHSPEPRHFNPTQMHPPLNHHPLRSPLKKEKAKRARSLSPKFSRRVFPPPHPSPAVNVSHYDAGTANDPNASESFPLLELTRMDSPESVKSDVVVSAYSSSRKPLRSSLRTTKEKDSSSSSLDSGKVLMSKVTISPRSSQVVFLPDEAGLQLSATVSQPTILSPNKRVTRGRPSSLGDTCRVDPQDRNKCVSTYSEKLDYSDEEKFLSAKLSRDKSHPRYDSTPELLQTFENELSTMKKDIANKDRMLSMYENSMADLSSKVHNLKKTLEEKDQEIRHLTEVKQTLFDLDGRSLASRMGSESGVLSDGCLSDSAMEPGHHGHKGDGKKKKKWKRWSFRRKSKDPNDLASSLDIESVISGKTGRSMPALRRPHSKSKPDLLSISEYAPEIRIRDIDAKSYSSEYATSMPGPMMYSNDDVITVYEDTTPGAKAPVTLLPGYSSYYSCYEVGGRGGGEEGEGEGTVMLGTISIAPEISWITMDTKICDIFVHHISSLDIDGNLGLSEDSILHYFIADQRREIGNALLPPLTPYQSLASGTTVRVVLRGALQGSCDALAYKVLINTETLQSYVSLLMETQWLVVMGTKGTCKTSLATGLSRHLMQIVCDDGEEEERGEVVVINYNVEKEGIEKLLLDMKENLSRKIRMWPRPPILVVDNIYECSVLEQILNTASNLPRRPYIIATLCTATMQGVPLHQLLFHHQMRVVTCNPQTEPVFGILSRSLRKQVYKLKAARIDVDPVVERLLQWLPYLLEHLDAFINRFHTQTVSLGPRVFMDCAVDQNRNDLETWFIHLWNHFVIPYLMGAIMAGIETYTADPHLEWVDVREFVVETYPWQPSVNVMKLRTLNPEDVGWNHAVRPQQNRFMLFKDDMKLPDDTRSLLSRIKTD